MTMANRIPVTVLTGFLGSGKTTILSNLLKRTKGRQLAMLINEFGEVSIDGALMRQGSDASRVEIHDLTQGLVAYSGDAMFLPTLQSIAARKSRIDHVLIETSGLAAPTAVMQALQGDELKDDFVLDAVVAVVDTPLFLSRAFDSAGAETHAGTNAEQSIAEVFDLQLHNADVVILNKIDTLSDEALWQAEEGLRTRSPSIRFVELAHQASVDVRLLLGLRLHQAVSDPSQHVPPPAQGTGVLADHSRLDGHAHSGLAAHEHGLMTHKHFHEQDPGWLACALRSSEPQNPQALQMALTQVAGSQPLLRVKGFLRRADDGKSYLIQGVRGRITVQRWEADSALAHWDLAAEFEDGHHDAHRPAAQDHGEPGTRSNLVAGSEHANVPHRQHGSHGDHGHGHAPVDTRGDQEIPATELVCIGYHLSRDAVRHVLMEVTSSVWH
jgi:cobalamin biosynthesis protein CobW